MLTTKSYLEQVRRKIAAQENKPISDISDYRIAKEIGITHQAVSKLINGKSYLDPNAALKVAEIIGTEPMRVIAVAEFERTKSPEDKARWKRWATAAMLASALIGSGILSPAPARAAVQTADGNIHYAKYRQRRISGAH